VDLSTSILHHPSDSGLRFAAAANLFYLPLLMLLVHIIEKDTGPSSTAAATDATVLRHNNQVQINAGVMCCLLLPQI
jgi:hypothetical protein